MYVIGFFLNVVGQMNWDFGLDFGRFLMTLVVLISFKNGCVMSYFFFPPGRCSRLPWNMHLFCVLHTTTTAQCSYITTYYILLVVHRKQNLGPRSIRQSTSRLHRPKMRLLIKRVKACWNVTTKYLFMHSGVKSFYLGYVLIFLEV